MIENYRWPGNIRELRNLVEQLSVLSEDHLIAAEDLLKHAPHLATRNLPINAQEQDTDFAEREILYKFLLEMKADLNDLKTMFYELVQRNKLEMPNIPSSSRGIAPSTHPLTHSNSPMNTYVNGDDLPMYDDDIRGYDSIVLDNNSKFADVEEVEESLSLDQKTKELITKALKKHKGRRKDAAEELGISERTLYRKIKEYEIPT